MFHNREDAAQQLFNKLAKRRWVNPIILAIPRGGIVLGAVLARELGAELDVVLSRKLRAPYQPELAIGAIAEDETVYLKDYAKKTAGISEEYINGESLYQMAEIKRRQALVRSVRPAAEIEGRTVILVDDGIATGSTMIAALETLKRKKPREVIVAVPVAPPEELEEIRRHCDELICLQAPESFWAIGQFYEEFPQVDDGTVIELLSQFLKQPTVAAG